MATLQLKQENRLQLYAVDIKGANVCAFISWLDPEEYTAADHGEIINGSE